METYLINRMLRCGFPLKRAYMLYKWHYDRRTLDDLDEMITGLEEAALPICG